MPFSSIEVSRCSGVKNLPANKATQEVWVQSLGWEDPLEEGMATHSIILARESHGQRSQSVGSQTVGYD